MQIALDYDDTFTKDKSFWTKVVNLAKEHGHTVTIVTGRTDNGMGNEDVTDDAKRLGIEAIFCGFVEKAKMFKADIWIDDSPLNIIPIETMQAMVRLSSLTT